MITDYSSLKSEIADFMARDDLGQWLDTFIGLSEATFNTELRCREMEVVATLTPVDNVCTLPADYLEYKRVVEKTSIRRRLDYITEDAADDLYPTRTAGLASHFMILGDELTALPISGNDIEIVYYRRLPPLTDMAPVNWLITKMPNLYLHACLMHAAEFIRDKGEYAAQAMMMQRCMDMLRSLDNRSKFGNAGIVLMGSTP